VTGSGPGRGQREARAERVVAGAFVVAILAGVGLATIYALGGQVQLEGLLLGLLLGGIGIGLTVWGKELFTPQRVIEARGPHGSHPEDVEAVDRAFDPDRVVPRRAFLIRLLVGALGALGLAAIFPIRSLGPSPGDALFRTAWRRGLRLVDESGQPVRADTLEVGGVITVFPEGRLEAEDSQAVVVRVDPRRLRLPPGRETWAPGGNVCYSKICTHAGCPVGLFSKKLGQLQCPCHQSAFDVLTGAQVAFGPAPRPLPQLDIEEDADGFLRARGDFDEPVGPGFWNFGRGPKGR
jgi:ubiquinol-cytochrome c reductase iron-sulfur subunit